MATDLRALSFDELVVRSFANSDAEEELNRRYATRAAVLVTDFSGMVHRTDAEGIVYALALARACEQAIWPVMAQRNGTMLKRVADTFFVVFESTEDALLAALDAKQAAFAFNASRTGSVHDRSRNDPIHPCMGLGYGEVLLIPDADVYGEEANRAFVLGEDCAAPHELLATTRFMEVLGTPPEGVGIHRAPEEREAEAGFSFHVVADYR